MRIHLLIAVFLAVATTTLAQSDDICLVTPTGFYTECQIDLTIVIDISAAMGNLTNIDNLFLALRGFLRFYAYDGDTETMLLVLGADKNYSINLEYFNDYTPLCNFLEKLRTDASVYGLNDGSLKDVLNVYNDFNYVMQKDPRNYQPVLLLLTAIDDEGQVNDALPVSQTLRYEHNVQIVTLNVGKNTSEYLPKLATKSYAFPSFDFSDYDLFTYFDIIKTTCISSGVTHETLPPMTTEPYDPSTSMPTSPYANGGDGLLCASNHKQAWLDLVFVIEHSSATFSQWNAITASIMSTVSQLTLSNTLLSGHTSRISVITYDLTGTKVQFNFTAEQTTRNVLVALNKAKPLPNLGGKADIAGGLKAAGDYLTNNPSFRAPGVVLYAATYDDSNTNDPTTAADGLKTDLIKIATVSFDESNGVTSLKIGKLASPGLDSNMHTPISQLLSAVSQLNCRCARGWTQLTVDTVSYAECFFYEDASAFQAFALCENTDTDVLALANTPARVDFIGQLVSKEKPTNVVSIGLSRIDSFVPWSWQGLYPYSGYPEFAQVVTDTNVYGYLSNSGNNNWQLLADDGMTTGRFYVCQRRSGDTDNIVEL